MPKLTGLDYLKAVSVLIDAFDAIVAMKAEKPSEGWDQFLIPLEATKRGVPFDLEKLKSDIRAHRDYVQEIRKEFDGDVDFDEDPWYLGEK